MIIFEANEYRNYRMSLSIKQEKFCNYYVESGNASDAYRRAYSCKGKSDNTIWVESSRLANNPKVALRISELRSEMQRRSDITKDEAVGILADIARANIVDALKIKSNEMFTTIVVKDVSALPIGIQRAILSVKSTDKGYELKLYNKIDAIEKLAKLLGWDATEQKDIVKEDKNDSITIQIIDKRGDVVDADTND
ncbi:terminase small subunit [Bacteroides sp.]|jgi:phage terminase small subunit|uniref:terminase small subunit n=1 Tax=Bacteroides sp. TaxID=29523 RepID=UPI002066FBFD|nr:MAG TPA: Terminase small subunit [Caudoviricetes sp.]